MIQNLRYHRGSYIVPSHIILFRHQTFFPEKINPKSLLPEIILHAILELPLSISDIEYNNLQKLHLEYGQMEWL